MALEQQLNDTLRQAIKGRDTRTADVVRMIKTRLTPGEPEILGGGRGVPRRVVVNQDERGGPFAERQAGA